MNRAECIARGFVSLAVPLAVGDFLWRWGLEGVSSNLWRKIEGLPPLPAQYDQPLGNFAIISSEWLWLMIAALAGSVVWTFTGFENRPSFRTRSFWLGVSVMTATYVLFVKVRIYGPQFLTTMFTLQLFGIVSFFFVVSALVMVFDPMLRKLSEAIA
jgi:hypothetical protein